MSSLKPLSNPDVTLSLALSSPSNSPHHNTLKPDERGILLIQLLLKCANHSSSGNLHRADTCLSEISELSSTHGDSMQRLAAWFASALAIRLVKRWPGLYQALNHDQQPQRDLDRARSLFVRAFPYLSLAYFIITRTMVRAMAHEDVIHIVDLGSCDSKFWVPLLRSLAHKLNGPPHLRVTCLNKDKAMLDKLGQRLIKEAGSLDMPFQFNSLNIGLKDLTIDMLNVKSGESLAFISILNLHVLLAEDDRVDAHFGGNKSNDNLKNSKQLNDILTVIRFASPRLLFVVEQEANHNLNRLVDRFVEGLHYYSAIFDSIDVATSGKFSSEDRIILEEMFGREIENIVACEGLERYERHERYARWAVRLAQAKFKPVQMWFDFDEKAKEKIDAFGKGYKIINDRSSLMICWHERPLYAVTSWTS